MKKTIAIVDDNRPQAGLLKSFLEKRIDSCEIYIFTSYEEMLEHERFDEIGILICDYNLNTAKNGLEAALEFKSSQSGKNIQVALLTGEGGLLLSASSAFKKVKYFTKGAGAFEGILEWIEKI